MHAEDKFGQVPLIFGGLLVTLWTWKSLMLIFFQKKIIYMPYIGRQERLVDHPTPGVKWHREQLRTSDGIKLALCRSEVRTQQQSGEIKIRRITIVYLQGNASSTPPRLPPLSRILLRASDAMPEADLEVWAISYRGYWDSSGRPTEAGLLRDVRESLMFIHRHPRVPPRSADTHVREDEEVEWVVWGHSIGASLAVLSLPQIFALGRQRQVKVILETPFDSIKSVLQALYPQWWLPYRYLHPFLRTRLDMNAATELETVSSKADSPEEASRLAIMVVKAECDEIVPSEVTDSVTSLLRDRGIGTVTERVVRGGLHQDCMFKPEMHGLVVDFIKHKS